MPERPAHAAGAGPRLTNPSGGFGTPHGGDPWYMPLLVLGLLLPLGLLVLMVVMDRVEAPLRRESVSDQLETFLDTARADEVETFVTEGYAPALERYWKRQKHTGHRAATG